MTEKSEEQKTASNFIRNIIDGDLASGKMKHIVTRFPPEPNGYLHVGHAFAALLSFTLSKEYQGSRFHLRFDDTNPEKEDMKYVKAIQEDLTWLGVDWGEHLYFASDYFDKLYEIATNLIKEGKAYVCSLSPEEVIEYRGTLTKPGKPSPSRDSSVEENLRLFSEMKEGKHKDGAMVLRAKIKMDSGNVHMRDPVLYRIRHVSHPRLKDKWCIYPNYDFTHCLSDAIESITHSLCSIEFQDHRPLYDWIVEAAKMPHTPRQYEFTRLNVNYTVTSKRKLKQLVDEKHVSGWDDPRMPTLAGMRARGYPPAAVREFCRMLGVSRRESVIDISLLEDCVRNLLNDSAKRAMAVLEPLKIHLTNYDKQEIFEVANHPKRPELGTREVSFSKEIYIERSDFQENPEKKYFRLAPGKEVRLRGSYIIKCEKVVKDDDGAVIALHCSLDHDTLGKKPEGRKVKGVIHWVDGNNSEKVDITEYDRLFKSETPADDKEKGTTFLEHLNPGSKIEHKNCLIEKSLSKAAKGETFQFERLGYFFAKRDAQNQLKFTKVVSLRDSWAKAKGKS